MTPVGMVNTTPNPVTVTLTAGEDEAGVDFGDQVVVRNNGDVVSIRGTKFQDSNGNGVRNNGEVGLQGWTIFLDTNNDGVLNNGETQTTTDANGNYFFVNLGPGSYRVLEVRQLGWVQMTNNPPVIVITVLGQNVTAAALGNARVASLISPSKLTLIGRNRLPAVMNSQARIVEDFYFSLLGRAPDLAGLNYYVRLLQAGYNAAQAMAFFRRDYRV